MRTNTAARRIRRPAAPARRGFSVIEALVAAAVLLVVSGGAYKLLVGGRQVFDAGVRGMDLAQEAHKAMIALGMDIRGASFANAPALADVTREVKPGAPDLADFLKLDLFIHTPDFSVVAGGERNVECKESAVSFEFKPKEGADGPYVLLRSTNEAPDPKVVAKRIKFGYFKRTPFYETKMQAGKRVEIYGTGPSVVQVHLELANTDQSGKGEGYKVAFDTAFQIRGCRLK